MAKTTIAIFFLSLCTTRNRNKNNIKVSSFLLLIVDDLYILYEEK